MTFLVETLLLSNREYLKKVIMAGSFKWKKAERKYEEFQQINCWWSVPWLNRIQISLATVYFKISIFPFSIISLSQLLYVVNRMKKSFNSFSDKLPGLFFPS